MVDLSWNAPAITTRCINRVDFGEFNCALISADWDHVFQCESTADKWNSFLHTFTPLLDSVAPKRRVQLRNPSAPPVSAVTRDLMARRRAALAAGLRGDYKALNRQSRAAIRRDCRDHIRAQISERGYRDMWRCVKPIIGSKKSASVVPNVHPDVLNEYFVGVGPTTAASVPHVPGGMPVRLPRVATCSFKVQPVTYGELWCVVRNMKSSSSCGTDQISVKLLQKCFDGIGHVLLDVINSSLITGEVPTAWKYALITALPKTKDLSDPSKFRPISVVPAISKILECIVHTQLTAYFDSHDLFSESQHGYRRNFSTETALTVINDAILAAMDRGGIAMLVLVDLSKCFDVVDHKMLLTKLQQYNIDLTWFRSYLQGHTQQVQIRQTSGKVITSHSLPNQVGVFQGTCLRPLMYSIFSNDLALFSGQASIIQYADDTQILVTGKKVKFIN